MWRIFQKFFKVASIPCNGFISNSTSSCIWGPFNGYIWKKGNIWTKSSAAAHYKKKSIVTRVQWIELLWLEFNSGDKPFTRLPSNLKTSIIIWRNREPRAWLLWRNGYQKKKKDGLLYLCTQEKYLFEIAESTIFTIS